MGRAECITHATETEEAGIRVGGVGEPAEQHRQQRPLNGRPAAHPRGQRLKVSQRARRIRIAKRMESLLGSLRSQSRLPRIEPGDGL